MKSRYVPAILLAAVLTPTIDTVLAQERRNPGSNQKCSTVDLSQRPPRPPAPDSSSQNSLSWSETTTQIAQLVQAAGINQQGIIIFEIDSANNKRSIDFHDLEYPKALRDEISRRIADHLNRWPEPYRILTMGPRYAPWDTTAQKFQTCPPALLNREVIVRLLQRAVAQYPGGRNRVAGTRQTVNMWLFTDRNGRVLLSIVKDPSGDSYFDREAKRIGREFAFQPALHDGFPLPVWVQIPIVFSIRQ
ncbi:MAG: energy transducer TonB [Gemmatimonadota bacterium]